MRNIWMRVNLIVCYRSTKKGNKFVYKLIRGIEQSVVIKQCKVFKSLQ